MLWGIIIFLIMVWIMPLVDLYSKRNEDDRTTGKYLIAYGCLYLYVALGMQALLCILDKVDMP